MAGDFDVKGADDFLKLSKALKGIEPDLRKALHKGLRDAANRAKPKAAEALAEALPSGLEGRGKRVKQAVQVKTGADPGVSIVMRYGKAGRGLGASNAQRVNKHGEFRHPVFADGELTRKEWWWVSQSVEAGEGWFDKTYMNEAPAIRRDLEQVMEDIAEQIVRKAR